MNAWAFIRRAAMAVREYFSPLRTGWLLIVIGAGLLAWDIALRLVK